MRRRLILAAPLLALRPRVAAAQAAPLIAALQRGGEDQAAAHQERVKASWMAVLIPPPTMGPPPAT